MPEDVGRMKAAEAGEGAVREGLAGGERRRGRFAEEPPSPLKRLQHVLHSHPTAIPGIVVLASLIIFSAIVGERFLQPFNLSLIVQQVMIIGIVGVAQTLVILTAGIDLSVGAIMVLSSMVMGKLAVEMGLPAPSPSRRASPSARPAASSTASSSPASACRPSSSRSAPGTSSSR